MTSEEALRAKKMSEERFQSLEEKLAFVEMANAEMGEEIFRQQQEIEMLTKAHQMLLQRVESLQDTAGQDNEDNNERPPHY
jgi:SlyX protein|tara:strand:- start:629 stop:871 length:243 start_codon:yes stop_codon:yes gene_type:complete